MRPGSIDETTFEDALLALSQKILTTRGSGLGPKVSVEEGRERPQLGFILRTSHLVSSRAYLYH